MRRLALALIVALTLSCSDGGTTGPKVEPVASVVVSPPTGSVGIGETLQLTATAKDAKGNVLSGRSFTWSSSQESAATVNSSGLATGVSEGTATITATCEGRSGSAAVSVVDLTPPAAPSDISAIPLSNTEIQVSWTDNSNKEDEFRIDRETVSEGVAGTSGGPARAFAQVGTVGPNVTTFVDTGLESATSYRYRVQACNENGCSDPNANQDEASTYAELVIETTSLPSAPVRVAFEQTLTSTGGDGTYTWSIASGSLPDGLGLNADSGTISGTPTALGVSAFTVRVESGDGQTANGNLALVVRIDCAAQSEIPESECEGLVAIYDSANGPGWEFSSGWLVDPSPCSWEEVYCEGGHVSFIELDDNQLVGTIPPEVGNFSSLRVLNLDYNQLSGGIPSALGNLTSLESLTLSSNRLTGPIPAELGNLENLRYLWLGDNQLTGSIPSELGELASLEFLYLSSNQLTEVIPPELGNLPNLDVLLLSSNQLTGVIPSEFGGLSKLGYLDLSSNQLNGAVPSELGNLQNLVILDLSSNQLGGPIPPELGSLSDLQELGLGSNLLDGSIPSELGNLQGLESLGLDSNQLTGAIPSGLGNLSQLRELSLHDNQLSGPIPSELGSLGNLERLSLHSNQLSDLIPLQVAQNGGRIQSTYGQDECTFAPPGNETLYMPRDSDYRAADLDGDLSICGLDLQPSFNCATQSQIPQVECEALVLLYDLTDGPEWDTSTGWASTPTPCSWYGVTCDSGSLGRLVLQENQLTGSIPAELGALSGLVTLDLYGNQLTGAIPVELGNLSDLHYLNLGSNSLTGGIPAELGGLANLDSLRLSYNELTGPIPAELSGLGRLEELQLLGNQLTGEIPSGLGNLESLRYLDLTFNQLTGPIPTDLTNLTNLVSLCLGGNHLTGPIPSDLGTLTNLGRLELRYNELTGPIPAELGSLSNLDALFLQSNHLTGPIPAELGNLSELSLLQLYENQLTGPIPAELGSLANLRNFILFGNELSGPVPLSVAQLGGLIQQKPAGGCQFVPPGNDGLYIPDTPDFRAADLDSDGYVCGVGFSAGSLSTSPMLGFSLLPR